MTTEDADLVAAVRAGDDSAFAELLRRHERSVQRLCGRLLRSEADAQDVTQEAFVHAFLGIERLRRPDAFGAWVHAIAANRALSALRGGRQVPLDPERVPQEADDALDAFERRDGLAAALRELSPEQREAFVGHVAGFSYEELARRAGVPRSTVRGRVFQSRVRLRSALIESTHDEETTPVEPIRVEPAVYGTFRRSTDRVLVLAELDGTRELPVRLSGAEAAAVEAALAGSELPERAPHELSLRLLRCFGARLERATIRDLRADGEPAYYATLTIATPERHVDVRADIAAGVALAATDDVPIVVSADVFRRRSWDPADIEAHRRADAAAQRRLRRRLAEGAAIEPVPPPRLPAATLRAVERALERLAREPGVRTVLLANANGAALAWSGAGDAETIGRYAAASIGDDDELAELTQHAVYPAAETLGGVRLGEPAGGWRLEAGIAEEWPPERWDEFDPVFAAVSEELGPLLASLE